MNPALSFRTRIFAISTLIVGTLLAVVMGLTWTHVVRGEAERLDERMCIEAKGLASSRSLNAKGNLSIPRRTGDLALKLRVNSSCSRSAAAKLALFFKAQTGRKTCHQRR